MPDNLTDAEIEAAIANGIATLAILDARKDSYSGDQSAVLPAIDEGLRAVVNEQLTVLAELQAARRQLAKVGELATQLEGGDKIVYGWVAARLREIGDSR